MGSALIHCIRGCQPNEALTLHMGQLSPYSLNGHFYCEADGYGANRRRRRSLRLCCLGVAMVPLGL